MTGPGFPRKSPLKMALDTLKLSFANRSGVRGWLGEVPGLSGPGCLYLLSAHLDALDLSNEEGRPSFLRYLATVRRATLIP